MEPRPLSPEHVETWRIVAERKIQDWIRTGGAEKLTLAGQPLDLDENPFLKQEYRLAFKILKNADMAPDWIMLGNDIEDARTALRELVRRFHVDLRHERARLREAAPDAAHRVEERIRRRRERFVRDFREQAELVNNLTDRFNVAVPIMSLGRVRLIVDSELDRALRGDMPS